MLHLLFMDLTITGSMSPKQRGKAQGDLSCSARSTLCWAKYFVACSPESWSQAFFHHLDILLPQPRPNSLRMDGTQDAKALEPLV